MSKPKYYLRYGFFNDNDGLWLYRDPKQGKWLLSLAGGEGIHGLDGLLLAPTDAAIWFESSHERDDLNDLDSAGNPLFVPLV